MTTSRQLAIGALLIGSSFLAADLGAALCDRGLRPATVPFETAVQPVAELGMAPALEALLGVPARAPEPVPSVDASVLRLHGTVLSEGDRFAVLETEGGEVRPVAVGEALAGWTVVEVESTHARLCRDGRMSEVYLASVAPPTQPVLTRPRVDAPPPILTREEAQVLLNDPGLAEAVRVHPAVAEGRMAGVRLEFRQPSHVLAWMGLRDGDVLMAVNDQPLLSLEDLHRGWNLIKNSSSVSFQVERAGQAIEIRYDFAR